MLFSQTITITRQEMLCLVDHLLNEEKIDIDRYSDLVNIVSSYDSSRVMDLLIQMTLS